MYNGTLKNPLSTMSLRSSRNLLGFATHWLCLFVGLGCWAYAVYILLAWPEQSDRLGPIKLQLD